MSDVQNAYNQIMEFISSKSEKTMLLCGVADKEKHRLLLKALNDNGSLKGLIYLINTTRDGMENFLRWAELNKVMPPKKYGQGIRISNLTLYFYNITIKSNSFKYEDRSFDFIIFWPIQSVTKNEEEIQMLKEIAKHQNSNKIFFLTRWLNEKEREFEAECVCWLVCERKGLRNPSAEYLNSYLDDNEIIPDISTDTVLKAVAMIESMLCENKNPRKEIITKTIDLRNE